MKVLVTGATGRVGGNLVKGLRDKGYEVRCFVLKEDVAVDKLKPFGVEIIYGDLRSYDDCVNAVKGVNAIFHIGAYLPNILNPEDSIRAPLEKNMLLFDVNIRGTFNLLEATVNNCRQCERFVFSSTDATYPSIYTTTVQDENHPLMGTGMYSVSKIIDEELIAGYRRGYALPTVAFRFAYVIGAGEILNPVYFPFWYLDHWVAVMKGISWRDEKAVEVLNQLEDKAKEGKRLLIPYAEDGKPYIQQLVDVRIVVQGLILGLEKPAAVGETFNLAMASPFSYEEAIPYISKALKIPYLKAVLPLKPIRQNMSVSKARMLLGYDPQYDIFKMVDSALAYIRGEDKTVVERGRPKV